MYRWGFSTLRRPWTLCVDFDDTCTVRDTIIDIAKLACNGNIDKTSKWDELVALFLDDYKLVMEDIVPGNRPCFSQETMNSFLDAYSNADLMSVQRVKTSKVLAGVARNSIQSKVDLKPGCCEILSSWPGNVIVLSSNWSRENVLSALAPIATSRQDKNLDFVVHSNELEFDANDISTGEIILKIKTPHDKARYVQSFQEDSQSVVYIGDGVNDLPALLAADLGLVLNTPNSSIFRVAGHVGLKISPFQGSQSSLLHVSTWQDVHTVLLDKANGLS